MQTKFQIWLQTANIETFQAEPELTRVVFLCADCPARSDCFESNDESLNCYDSFEKWANTPFDSTVTNLQKWLTNAQIYNFQKRCDATKTIFHECEGCPAKQDCHDGNWKKDIGCFYAFKRWANLPHEGNQEERHECESK